MKMALVRQGLTAIGHGLIGPGHLHDGGLADARRELERHHDGDLSVRDHALGLAAEGFPDAIAFAVQLVADAAFLGGVQDRPLGDHNVTPSNSLGSKTTVEI